MAESFFEEVRAERIDHVPSPDRKSAEGPLEAYFDGFYVVQRRHWCLDYVSSPEFELRAQMAAFAER